MRYQRMSPRTKAGERWFKRIRIRRNNDVTRRTSAAVSSMMKLNDSVEVPQTVPFRIVTIEQVTDWLVIAKKYRALMGLRHHTYETNNNHNERKDSQESEDDT